MAHTPVGHDNGVKAPWAFSPDRSRKSVPDFHLVLGSPARSVGAVCKCGMLFHKFTDGENGMYECECGLAYEITDRVVLKKL